MITIDECYHLLENFQGRMDSLEELLKIIAVNSLLEEMNIGVDVYTSIPCDGLKEIIQEYEISIWKTEFIEEKEIVYLQSDHAWKVDLLREIKREIALRCESCIIPVFVFEKVYGTQKKRMRQDKISYFIRGNELNIFLQED